VKELITIKEKNGIETVNARELHSFLESKRRFSDWFKQRVDVYGFEKGIDFTDHKSVIGKATQIDYFISVDMAKELSMVENNAKGKIARQYFIAREKQAKMLEGEMSTTDLERKLLIKQGYDLLIEEVQSMKEEMKNLAIKASVADQIAETEGLMSLSDVGRLVTGHSNTFIKWLVENGILFYGRKDRVLRPYSPYEPKYLVFKVYLDDGVLRKQTFFTNRGAEWACGKYQKDNNLLNFNFNTDGIIDERRSLYS
jgi:anti-repressor protein